MGLPLLVLDASAALALVLAEAEGTQVAEALGDVVGNNGQVFVPALFWYEVGNGLLNAQRSKRITESQCDAANALLSRLPMVTDTDTDTEALGRTMALARAHELSFYDAAYLELALRLRCRLKSVDRHLLALREQHPFTL
jgi:predicted nucleic acid-binding protein